MNALCLVAHPDDCVIFAYSFMHHWSKLNWTVAYLTYQAHEPRAQEFIEFWSKRNIPVRLLGFEDDWHDNEQKQFNKWTEEQANSACWKLARDYDIVLTHDEHGDYGHIHHALIHDAVKWHPRLVTFAPPGRGTDTYTIPQGVYSLDEFPMHKDIVASFHSAGHLNSYTVPGAVKELLESQQ